MALSTAISATPTSANTASHIGAIPIDARMSTANFITSESTMLVYTVRIVCLAFFMLLGIEQSPVAISVASPVSRASELPLPMDMEKSATSR